MEEVRFTLDLVEQSRRIQELLQLVISILAHSSVPAWNQESQLPHLIELDVTLSLHSGQYCFAIWSCNGQQSRNVSGTVSLNLERC